MYTDIAEQLSDLLVIICRSALTILHFELQISVKACSYGFLMQTISMYIVRGILIVKFMAVPPRASEVGPNMF